MSSSGCNKTARVVNDPGKYYLLEGLTRTVVAIPFPVTPIPLLIRGFLILVSLLDVSRRTPGVRDAGLLYTLGTDVAHWNDRLVHREGAYSPPMHGEQNICLRNRLCHRASPDV
jgi:hypothetical protein